MRQRTLALCFVLPALLTSCAGGNTTAQPTVTVTQTVTMTASPKASPMPAPPPTQTGPMPLGTTAKLPNGGTVTVYEHRKEVEPQDPNQEAIDVQMCAPSQPAGSTATISDDTWSLRDASSRSYKSASTTWRHPGAVPGFWPPQQQLQTGDCYRAWVIIQGSSTIPMTTARYSDDETRTVLEWALSS